MSVREFLNNNSAVATIVAVVLLVLALGIIVWQNKGPTTRDYRSFYYDLNTKEIFVDDGTKTTPFDNGNGTFEFHDGPQGSAVRAYVFTCGDPEAINEGMTLAEIEAAGGYIAYLERMTPEMREMQEKLASGQEITDMDYGMTEGFSLIAPIDGAIWFSEQSEQAMNMMTDAMSRCGADRAQIVLP